MSIGWMVPYNLVFFMWIGNPRRPVQPDKILSLDHTENVLISIHLEPLNYFEQKSINVP